MWKRLPLSLKLILPLVGLQLAVMVTGVTWSMAKLRSARVRDLDRILDSDADVIEDAITSQEGRLDFRIDAELVRELYQDRDNYFSLSSPEGTLLAESQGPSEEVRAWLRRTFATSLSRPEHIFSATSGPWHWRVVREAVTDTALGKRGIVLANSQGPIVAYLNVGINASPSLREVAAVQRYIGIGALGLALLTSLGSAVVVSHTTSTLRLTAKSLRAVSPHHPEWTPPAEPQSAEEKLLFDSFQTMLAAIRKASTAQRLFVANASHELKTPVAGMLLALQVMLSRRRSPEDYEATGRDLLRTVEGLRRLTSTLLDLARLENADAPVTSRTEISQLIADVLQRWRTAAANKRISLVIISSPDEIFLNTNVELFGVALGNFIDNAIKYSDPGGVVEISVGLEASSRSCFISVADKGVGMSASDVSRLGEVFFRANEARPDDMSYGLGFAQAYRIVSLLGGELTVTSSLGQGTKVVLRFPT